MSLGRVFRLGFLGLTALIVLIISIIGENIDETPIVRINTYYNNLDGNIKEYLNGIKFNGTALNEATEEKADVVISVGDYKPNWNNYTEDVIGYSPIVAVFPEDIFSKGDKNFIPIKGTRSYNNNNYDYYLCDLKAIIDQLTTSEIDYIDLSKLGYTKYNKEVKLGIPAKGHIYRKACIDAILNIIIGEDEITEKNINDIISKLNTVLGKSVEITNYSSLVPNNKNYIMIVPEYVLGTISNYYQHPVYYRECDIIQLKLYTNSTTVIDGYREKLVVGLSERESLFNRVTFRNNAVVTKNQYQDRSADSVDYVIRDDNLNRLFGYKYWE